MILEYAFGAATVAVGWSGHLRAFLHDLGWNLPASPTSDFVLFGMPVHLKYDYVGFLVIMVITTILVIGIKESANFTTAVVIMKVAVVLHVHRSRRDVFDVACMEAELLAPIYSGEYRRVGALRMVGHSARSRSCFLRLYRIRCSFDRGARSEESEKRYASGNSGLACDLHGALYFGFGLLTHIVPYQQLNVPDPVVVGIRVAGQQWATFLVEIGALGGLATVMLVMLLGQSRVFYSMSRDGLLWPWAGKIHPRFRTPYLSSIVVGIFVAILATIIPLSVLDEMTSVGTLLAFVLVSAGVWVMRQTHPELQPAISRLRWCRWFRFCRSSSRGR